MGGSMQDVVPTLWATAEGTTTPRVAKKQRFESQFIVSVQRLHNTVKPNIITLNTIVACVAHAQCAR